MLGSKGFASALILGTLLAIPLGGTGWGRDPTGKYASSPLKPWFDGLRSGKGPCCSDADGHTVNDADWESVNDDTKPGVHYRVHIPSKDPQSEPGAPMVWVDVTDDAVITEPNLSGRTIVWPVYYSGYGATTIMIRCFIIGPLT